MSASSLHIIPCQHQPLEPRENSQNQGHQQTRQETSRISGQMRLKHRIQLKQHRAQVKVFALVFILCHVASCQPKYKDSLLMCWVLRKSSECAVFQNQASQKSIFIALIAEHSIEFMCVQDNEHCSFHMSTFLRHFRFLMDTISIILIPKHL